MVLLLIIVRILSEYLGNVVVDLLLENINGNREYNKKVIILIEFKIRKSCYKI